MRLFPIIIIILFFSFIACPLKGQITTLFGSNTTKICAPGVIQFGDSSSSLLGTIVQWQWKRDGVVFSTLKNPALFFNNPGTYDICLKVTDNLGNSDSLCINDYITAFRSPTTNFSANRFIGCRPFLVDFTDSSILGDAPIRQWRWDFGDGFIDTINQHSSHLYNTIGNFDVTLVVIDTNGCSSSLLKPDLITIVDSVTAAIGHNAYQVQCGLPANVTFTGLSNGVGYNYTWYFGDNTTGTGANISHSYLGSGCFRPTLVVGNGLCSATATVASCITISDSPTASFTVSNPTACALPYTPIINNQSSGQTSNSWSFGDGFTSSALNPNHPFTTYRPVDSVNYYDGVFPIYLTVSNSLGCTSRDTQLVYVSNLQVAISVPTYTCAPDSAILFASSYNGSPAFYSTNWIWTADHLVYTNGYAATTYYPDSGIYNAHVIVTDNIGCKDTVSNLIYVGIIPMIDTITIDTNYICRITGINFAGFGSSYIDTWNWAFSDGSGGNGDAFHHFFQDTGYISGYVTASFRGCIDTVDLDTYYIMPPIAKFSPVIICDSLLVNFIDESIGAHRWFWDFGDTTTLADTSHLQNPSYAYPGAGTYWVILTVWNDTTGCVDTFRQVVNIGSATAIFSIPDSICTIATFTPTNNSINASAYQWLAYGSEPFTNTEATPTFIFRQPGIYNIRLSAFDANGCIDTSNQIIHIAGLDTNILYSPIPACRPAVVNFVDSSIGILSPIVGWQWGNGSTQRTATQVYSFPGPQNMNLTVTNSWGCTFPLVKKVDVGGIFLNFSSARDVCIGNLYTGIAIVTSPSNANAFKPYTFVWDFGNGHRDTSLSNVINYTYPAAGVYTVCLYVIDSLGCVSTLCRPDWVTVHDPTSLFTADTFYSTCPPLEVNFSNLSLSGTQWTWNFGDGSVSTLQHPTHVYSTPGFYNVTLSVTAFPGCFSTRTINQMIQITGPTGSFTMPPISNCAPYTAQFTATGNNIANYTWLFGNGDSQTNINSSSTDTVYYTYTQAGTYVPILVMDDGIGCQIPIEGDTIVITSPPNPTFSSDSLICQLDSIHYQLLNPLVGNMSVEWFFEGGFPASSNIANPTIYYPDTGSFNVMLVLWKDNCSDTLLKIDYISIKARPTANFALGILDSCAPILASFSDSSTTEQGFIQAWWWDFGNGQTASTPDTALWYNLSDTFVITLVVENNFGCRDTANRFLQTYPSPSVDIGTYTPLCVGDTLQLQGIGTGTFLWTSTAWLSDSSLANPLTVLDSTQRYFLEIQNSFGCRALDSIDITAVSTLLVDAGDSLFICLGDNVILNATGNVSSFDWGVEPTLSCQFCSNPTANPSATQTYYLQPSTTSSCSSMDSVVVVVHALPLAQILLDTVCLGDSVHFSTLNAFAYNLQWTVDGQISSITDSTLSYLLQDTTTVNLLVVDDNGCRDSLSILATPLPLPLVDAGTYPTLCVGDTLQLQGIGNGTFNWSSSAWLSNSIITNPLTVVDSFERYVLTVFDNNGCSAIDSVDVFAVSLLLVEAGDTAFICLGDTVRLNATGNTNSFDWGIEPTLSCQFCSNPIANPSSTQTYYLQPNSSSSCSTMDSVVVVVHSLPIAQLSADTSICLGDTVQFIASGGLVYQWLEGQNLSDSTIYNPFATPTMNGFYTVEVLDLNNCKDSVRIFISIFNNNSIPLSDQTICLGDSIVLSLINGSNPTWSGNFLSCNNCPQPTAAPTDSNEYLVSYYNNNNCLVQDSLWIRVVDLSSLQALASDTICLGDTVQLSVLGTNGLAVTWFPNYALSSNTIQNPLAFPSVDTQYIVQINQGACVNQDTVFIKMHPSANISTLDVGYCIGDTAQLIALGNATTYTWTPSNFLSDSTLSNPLVFVTTNQQYQVIGTSFCNNDTAFAMVSVSSPPLVQLDSNLSASLGSSVVLNSNADPSYTFSWSPSDSLSCNNCPNPSWLVSGNKVFYVTVTNALGCAATDSIVINFYSDCTPNSVFVPNAFTPDADGHNDVLFAQSGSIQEIVIFQIYNRWGQLVFETNNMLQGWDGIFQGKPCPPDVFGYYLIFRCPNTGEEILKKGNITILR